jgi:heme/copper-type cytochrome/quinol oxidase subunit 2
MVGIWLILLSSGIAGLLGIRIVFAPGWRRSVAYALIAGLFFTPTLLFGHGVAIVPALVGVFVPFPAGNWDTALMFASLRAIALAVILVFAVHVSVVRVVSGNGPQDHETSGSARTEIRWLSVMIGVLACAVAATWTFRAHWRVYKASIGPFSITVDTGSPALSDVGAVFQCSNDGIPVVMSRQKLRSDGVVTVPAQYVGPVRGPLQCKLRLMHPELPRWYTAEFTVNAKPRQHVILQATAPRWSQEVMLQNPVGSTRERDFYYDTNELAVGWLPFMCRSDLERAKRLYIPMLVERRRDVLAGHPPQVAPDEDYARVLAESWKSNCESLASRRRGLP